MKRILLTAVCAISAAACTHRREPSFTFTELAFPGAESTVAAGINAAGHVVGWYRKGERTSGFLYQDGTFRSIEYSGAILTQLYGISSDGEMVGAYRKPGETQEFMGQRIAFHGFLRRTSGEFLDIGHPGHRYSMAQRILPDGSVVGCFHDHDATTTMRGITVPREAIAAGGVAADSIAVLEAPASMHNGGTGKAGKVVGLLNDGGKAYVVERGELTTFTVPDASRTEAWDINPSGTIVGVFVDAASVSHGFVLENGRFTTLDVPGSTSTVAFGINARGDIVGGFVGPAEHRRGFIAVKK